MAIKYSSMKELHFLLHIHLKSYFFQNFRVGIVKYKIDYTDVQTVYCMR